MTIHRGHLVEGQSFPAFSLSDGQGRLHTLREYQGKYVLLYVYPKDDTPGCTQESCDFRDNLEFKELGVVILGLSGDDAESHLRFAAKYDLPFPLLSDSSLEFIRQIGAYGTKNLYGKVSEGIKRSTFLIDPMGNLIRAWYAVKVKGHASAVLQKLRAHLDQRSRIS